MKSCLVVLFALFSLTATAQAQSCQSADGLIIPDGVSVKLYYSQAPAKEIGPNYTCANVSRVRTCVSGALSEAAVVCSDRDSGGCADSWIEQLEDSAFTFAQCQN